MCGIIDNISFIRWGIGMEYLLDIINKALKNNDQKKLNEILDIIIEQENVEAIYNYYLYTGILNNEMIETLRRVRDPKYVYLVAYYCNSKYLDELTDIIIEINDPWFIYLFASNVINSSLEKLAIALANTGNISYMYKLVLELPEATKIMANQLIRQGHSSNIINFAVFFPKAPVNSLINEIIKRNNMEDIYNLYTLLKEKRGYNSKKLFNVILEQGTGLNVYLLALQSQEVTTEIVEALVLKNDSYHIFDLILKVNNAPIESLLDALKNMGIPFDQSMLNAILASNIVLTNKLKAIVWFDYNFNIRISEAGFSNDELLNILITEFKLYGDDKSVFAAIEILKGNRGSIIDHQSKIKKFDRKEK